VPRDRAPAAHGLAGPHADAPEGAALREFELVGGVYLPRGEDDSSAAAPGYRGQWEHEAAEDPIQYSIARASGGRDDYATLTGKVTDFWREFPAGQELENVVEIGCGYGRIPLFLSRERGLRCRRYYGIDISAGMLRRFAELRERFDVFPGADLRLIRASADRLPLDDDSIDFVMSTAVFLHMGRGYALRALEETARVLRRGGTFAFDASFPNALAPANLPSVARNAVPLGRKPNQVRFYTRRGVDDLMRRSGLASKCPDYRIEASGYALLPKSVSRVRIPLAARVNAAIGTPPPPLRRLATTSYSVRGAAG
jgi:SAM-dependent methyltransferase